MIPLVGWLLSYIAIVAAVIFALVVGVTLSITTIAVAWIVFRPLYGILLLTLVGVSVYLAFFYDWKDGSEASTSTTTSETITTTSDDNSPASTTERFLGSSRFLRRRGSDSCPSCFR